MMGCRRLICRLLAILFVTLVASFSVFASDGTTPPPLIFGLGAEEPKTIGDVKPSYLLLDEQKALPKVSIEYVLERYRKLYDNAKSPSVKIDALNRINTLSAKYGISSPKINIDTAEQNQAVLDAYDRIVNSGVFFGRMDEFIYQSAKALEATGNIEKHIERLEYLIGLFPESRLYDEAHLRAAEGYFKLRNFIKAETLYKKLLVIGKNEDFKYEAQFRLGWTQYHQNRLNDAAKSAVKVLDTHPELRGASSTEKVAGRKGDIAADTLRLLALTFSKGDGAVDIENLQTQVGHKDYAFLLYDSLFRFFLAQRSFADAANTAELYNENYFNRPDSYAMLVRAIRAYRKGELPIEEWRLKEKFVSTYGIKGEFWQSSAAAEQEDIRSYLTLYLDELAHLNYVRMQQAKTPEEKTQHALLAANYYIELSDTDPVKDNLGQRMYLAGEALTVAGQVGQAIPAYERAAYDAPAHKDSAEAGYAAILSYQDLPQGQETMQARRTSVVMFTDRFAEDSRTPVLLTDLAQTYLGEKAYAQAIAASQKVTVHTKADQDALYSSWLVNAHANFESGNFVASELGYTKTLAFKNKIKSADDRKALRERLAASIYKQAEQHADPIQGAGLFLKVVDVVPESSFGAQAIYDAATSYLKGERWQDAIATMNFFQQSHPQHEFNKDIEEKLVFAYINNDEPVSAAESLLDIAERSEDKARSMDAVYQAATLYRDAGFELEHVGLLERFVSEYSEAFDLNMEAYDTLAKYYLDKGFEQKGREWREKLIAYEASGGTNRTGRSRTLAAATAYQLALLDLAEYNEAKLTLPLKDSLNKKKALLNQVVEKFEAAADYGISEYVTAATFQLGQVYRTLSADLLASERPTGLDELAMEQYNILLEEQAYPFEEQAIALFEVNTVKAREGNYDEWIQKSFTVLAQMNPTLYKRESMQTEYAPEFF